MIRRTLEGLPHVIEIGLEFLDIDRGRCSARLPYRRRLAGNPESGILHGGAVTTLMDTVGGAAAFSVVAKGSSVATLDLRIDYLRSARPTDAIVGEASCYRLARSVAFVRGEAFDMERNHPVAHFVATFAVGSIGFVPGNKQGE
jgi:uncharacterized protein (TIGR00369 family)